MQLNGMLAIAICSALVGVSSPALAESGSPTRLEGYLDTAPPGTQLERTIVIGVAGKVRRLLVTRSSTSETKPDRVVGTADVARGAILPVAHGGHRGSAGTGNDSTAAPPQDAALALVGRATEVDGLVNQPAGAHFGGEFDTAQDGRLEIRSLK